MSGWFDPHASIAVLDIACNGFAHLWPPVVLGYKLVGGSSSWVAYGWVFVARVQDFGLEEFIIWDVQEFVDIKEAVIVGTFSEGSCWGFCFKVLEGKED